ncbi:LOW QUALITY PROTEIN: neuroglian-like [Centruroides vittatus]|uniref:LOW QUALITY PROTEIN: neuroglian-like n=1 Tax=Centruroides vittatus TaxID=120091 RepID=UPI003510BD6C
MTTLRIWQLLTIYIPVLHVTSVIAAVQYPPTMIKQPPYEQLYQVVQNQDERDKPFTLECEADGNPEPVYRWNKNGLEFDYVSYDKRISQQPRRGTLCITKPENIDEGLYQCFAENIHGTSVSNSVFLRKSELNSFPDTERKVQEVKEGQPLTLYCSPPTGYPKPSIFWLMVSNSGALHTINSSRLTVDPEGNLHFSNVTREDSVKDQHYACSATSFFRNEYKLGNRISLNVQDTGGSGQASYEPTKQYVSPPAITALRGQSVLLSCIFGGTPIPQIDWRRKNGNLHSGRYHYEQYGRSLKISPVTLEDEGIYECTASNGNGKPQSHAMNVTVQAAPYWIEAPNNTNEAEGESVKFVCHAEGVPVPKLQWFINGEPIEKVKTNERRSVHGNVLIIDNLEKVDTAVYQCNASNIHGYVFRDFYLNVLALPPTITNPPEPLVKAVVTSTVVLRCKVFGAPRPDVKWIKNGQELTGGRYQVVEDGNLEIKNVLVTDQGDYTCYARNKFGEAREHGRLEVKSKTKIIQPPENFEVAAGKSATFRCNAEADPTLELRIIWLFNEQPIDFDQDPRMVQASDNSLTITKTIELDSGIYACLAQTDLDQDEASATLTVQDVPNPPKVKKVTCAGLSATLEWQPMGDRRAPILSYTIQYNTSFQPDSWANSFTDVPASDKLLRLPMSPWANYTFRVIARNKIGPSLPSAPSDRCETPTDVPYKNPDKVEGYGTEPDNLIISWTPMPPIDQNAPGFFYKVFWKREDIKHAAWEHEKITDWKQNQFIVYNQPTFKPYRIKVEAHNQRGQANVIPTEIIGYSGEDVPEEAPKNFHVVTVKDARSALMAWNHVPKHTVRGHFKGYKIQAWTPEEGEEHAREEIVGPDKNESLVSILRPNAENKIAIFVFNERYTGPRSEVIQFRTPEGTPGPVASFDAVPLGASAFYLIWKRPLEPNGNLTGYRIYYEEVHGTALGPKIERKPPITMPIETRAKLAGLKPNTKYRITIYATTKVGQGMPYFIELKTNKESDIPPDAPNFKWYNLPDEEGKAGVLVTWMPAVEGRPGSHFYVQYRRKGENQWESTPPEEIKDTTVVRGLELGTLYEMRVVSVDGTYHVPSKIEEIDTGDLTIAAPDSADNVATAAWFIGMMCAIALLLLLLIIVCLIKRNRGGKYSVHEKEAAQGHDLDYPDDGGFNEYTKPRIDNQNIPRGSRMSLSSSLKGAESDTDSMADYGEGETGQFGEDGSFIGQYGAKKKKEEPTSPSALATFV